MVSAGVNFERSNRLDIGGGRVAHTATAPASDLAEDLLELKRARNAVILAHNYQVP